MREWCPIGYDYDPPPWFTRRRTADMRVPDKVIKSVAFIGIVESGEFRPRATGFFVSYEFMQHRFMALVTAEHVISGLLTANRKLYARVNLINGDVAVVPIPIDRWRFYPDKENRSDVAACPMGEYAIAEDNGERVAFDVMTLALNGKNAIPCTSDVIRRHEIGIGEEVFIVGLFRSHYGKERNLPIVRVGNLAAMMNEPVNTKYVGYTDAYLVEAMSIGGLSGSPIFVHMAPIRQVDGKMRIDKGYEFYLLGLVNGHFDIRNLSDDSVVEDVHDAVGSINTGIGVVIPVEKILATIEHPDFQEERRIHIMENRNRDGATSDLMQPDHVTSDTAEPKPVSPDNPSHLEDFNRLVDVAARKRPRDDQP